MAGTLNTLIGDFNISGNLSATTLTIPSGTITDAGVNAAAAIAASKSEQQPSLHYGQADGTAVVSQTWPLHIVSGVSGSVLRVQAIIPGLIATGADRTVTIDVQKGNAASAYATVLTAPIVFTNVSALRTVSSAAIAAAGSLLAGDSLRVVVTVAGAAGAQAQGLNVTVTIRELPQ